MSEIGISERDSGVRFTVRVQPRASRSEVMGAHGTALKVRVAAAPVDGAANEALVEILARELGVPRNAVRIVSGEASRTKVMEVSGVDALAVHRLAANGT